MKAPKFTAHEPERQVALEQSGLLDSSSEERFDRFTLMACRMFGVPIALVSLIDHSRQWFKFCQGLKARGINVQAASGLYNCLKQSERRARAAIDGTRVATWKWNVQTG